MFTPEHRKRLRSELLARAAADARISGAAITGSAAIGREDRWSDVDLAFGIADPGAIPAVMADWTAHMYERWGALDHVDVPAGSWIYRVFLLPGTLQVDLAFVAAADFRPLAESFHLISGTAREAAPIAAPKAGSLIGMAWLFGLHARSSIERNRLWQAEYMVSGVRDYTLALACLRFGRPAAHGRGLHDLPPEVVKPFEATLVRAIDTGEIRNAFRAVIELLIREVRFVDESTAGRLEGELRSLGCG